MTDTPSANDQRDMLHAVRIVPYDPTWPADSLANLDLGKGSIITTFENEV